MKRRAYYRGLQGTGSELCSKVDGENTTDVFPRATSPSRLASPRASYQEERADKARQEILKRFGVQEIAADLVRAMRKAE